MVCQAAVDSQPFVSRLKKKVAIVIRKRQVLHPVAVSLAAKVVQEVPMLEFAAFKSTPTVPQNKVCHPVVRST